MAEQIIDVGTAPNNGTGDPLRTAFIKTDNNFDQIWAAGPVGSNVRIQNNVVSTLQVNQDLALSPNGVGNVRLNNNTIPGANNTWFLGSTTNQWRGVYANSITAGNVTINNNLVVPGDVTIEGNLTVEGDTIQIGNIVTDTKTIQLSNTASTANAATGSGITVGANDNIATLLYNSASNVWTTNIGANFVGNVTAPYFFGNGSQLTGLPVQYGNANVVTLLSGFGSNTISTTGNISGGFILGNLAFANGLPATYSNANAVAYGEAGWAGNIIPSGNAVYSLGNATNQWNDLYVSNATIFMNNVPISLSAGNVLTVNGNAVLQNNSNSTISTTGNITAGNIGITGGSLTWANASIVQTSASDVSITGDGQVTVRSLDGTYQWTFDSNGNLILPGSIIGASTIELDNRAYGNSADINLYAADDILLQARDRTAGSTTEGGDINIYAGDSAEDGDSSGGDVQIRAGDGGAANVDFGGSGGFITIQSGQGGAAIGNSGYTAESGGALTLGAGDAGSNNGNIDLGAAGGDVYIGAGDSTGNTADGGGIYITSGAAGTNALAGQIQLTIPPSDSGSGGVWIFDGYGNLTAPGNVSASGNISGAYIKGNGSELTNLPAPTVTQDISSTGAMSIMTYDGVIKYVSYATVEPSSGNITGGNISTTGNVTANYFIGDGSQLTNLPGGNATLPLANGTSNFNIATANGSANITANAVTYTFGTDSRLTVPAAANVPGKISALTAATGRGHDLRISAGNTNGCSVAGGDMYLSAGVGYGGVGWGAGNVNIVTGDRYSNDIGNTWRFDFFGNLNLPGNTFAVNYANGTPVSIGGGGNTGNVTFNDVNIIGTGNLKLQPDPANASAYLDIYLTAGPDIHIAGNGETVILGTDDFANVTVNVDGNVSIQASNGTPHTWTFDTAGNLTLPGNTIAINYLNGNLAFGTVTFNNEAVIGTGTSNTVSGLYLAPDPVSLANDLYLRVRGNIQDEPTHIHFDTGNNQYYNQFIGDDNKYIQLANTGNIVINSNDNAGNTAQWTFGTDGLLTFPTGNLVITPDDPAGNIASIVSTDHPLGILSTGANGAVSSLWVEDYANVGASNIAAVYANPTPGSKIVRIAVGQNGSPGPNLWDFDTAGNLTVPGNIIMTTGIVGSGASPAPYLSGFSSVSAVTVTATGNVTGGNLITAGSGGAITMTGGNITGANVVSANIFSATGNITTAGNLIATGNVTAANFFGNGNTLSNVATTFESTWTVPTGNSTQNFTVTPNNTYYLWVDCNIPNGILTWNATATVTNTNVPVVGAQYAWVYNGGGTPIDFTSIPNQFVGTSNTIVRSSVAPSATTNRFDFGINNASGNAVTVRYGWAQIS